MTMHAFYRQLSHPALAASRYWAGLRRVAQAHNLQLMNSALYWYLW